MPMKSMYTGRCTGEMWLDLEISTISGLSSSAFRAAGNSLKLADGWAPPSWRSRPRPLPATDFRSPSWNS